MHWSPEQISGWLKRTYPDDESFQLSHETIYRSLFVQARRVIGDWREHYNHVRAHSSPGYLPPSVFANQAA